MEVVEKMACSGTCLLLETKVEGDRVGDEDGHAEQIMKGLPCPSKLFRFYPAGREGPLKNSGQGRKMGYVG